MAEMRRTIAREEEERRKQDRFASTLSSQRPSSRPSDWRVTISAARLPEFNP